MSKNIDISEHLPEALSTTIKNQGQEIALLKATIAQLKLALHAAREQYEEDTDSLREALIAAQETHGAD